MSPFPNPDTYLNHLTPAVATQFEVSRNLTLAVFGAAVWDILLHIPDDIRILRRGPIHLVTICFISTRLFAIAFVLLSVIRQTGPVDDCDGMISKGIGITCMLAHMTCSFLFLQRLRAVYARNQWVKNIFFGLWLISNGLMTTTIYGAPSSHISGTDYCIYVEVHQYIAAAGFMSAFFDTAVFLAISYKLSISHGDPSIGFVWHTVVSGKRLPRLSRAVLHGGQQYYLITTCLSIPVATLILLPAVPPTYKLMLSFPLVALSASMACRVFRNLRLLRPADDDTFSATISDANFGARSFTSRFLLDTGEAGEPLPKSQDYECSTNPCHLKDLLPPQGDGKTTTTTTTTERHAVDTTTTAPTCPPVLGFLRSLYSGAVTDLEKGESLSEEC